MRLYIQVILLAVAIATVACDKNNRSFSLMAAQQTFQQSGDTFVQRKIDILWVVDNSGSMQTSQANLVNNFNSFIQKFQTLGFDYRMAVTTTDAYLADPFYNDGHSYYAPTWGKFRDGFTGTYGYGRSGIYVMTPQNTTANIFKTNISVGASGIGDERAFSSFVRALTDPANASLGFRRPDAFLAIIILSDEDDFSGTASNDDHFSPTYALNYVGDKNYNAPAPLLQPVSYYANWLDNYAGGRNNYSVSAIYTDSEACRIQLDAGAPSTSRTIAQRYPQLADLTRGQKGSLCSNFGTTLQLITNSVVELASIFQLNRQPIVSTIRVSVNGASIANDAINGWTYDAATNSVAFHGASIPQQGATISIVFDPLTAMN